MLDIPHAALPAILFDNLIGMPVGEYIEFYLTLFCLPVWKVVDYSRGYGAVWLTPTTLQRFLGLRFQPYSPHVGRGGPKGMHMDSSTFRCRRFGRQGESKHRGTALSGGLIGGETKCWLTDVSFTSPQDRKAQTRSTSVVSTFIHT